MLARVFERSISRNVADKSFRFGGELPKAIGFASETSKSATFVIIQDTSEKTCLYYNRVSFPPKTLIPPLRAVVFLTNKRPTNRRALNSDLF